jgi:predicted nucleotidyltransferase
MMHGERSLEREGVVPATIVAMVDRIVAQAHPERVILFGSHATGHARPDSDVDLLIVVPDEADPRAVTVQLYRSLAGMGVPKDLIVVRARDFARWRAVPGTVVSTAQREGRVLYGRSA